MYAVGRLSSYISQGVYTVSAPFHPFGGAVDIIVVEQPDGSFKSSPWYVRFGKFQGVLKTREKIVNITINGNDVDFHMYLDHTGEAYFLREEDVEEIDSTIFSTPTFGDETDADSCNGSFNNVKQPDFDSPFSVDNGQIMVTADSRQSGMFGLLFGRKSMKKNNKQQEGGDAAIGRVSSLESAEIAADLLDVKWSTNLPTDTPRRSKLSATEIPVEEPDKGRQVNGDQCLGNILVQDTMETNFDHSFVQESCSCDGEMRNSSSSGHADTEHFDEVDSPAQNLKCEERDNDTLMLVTGEKFELSSETSTKTAIIEDKEVSEFVTNVPFVQDPCTDIIKGASDERVHFSGAGFPNEESENLFLPELNSQPDCTTLVDRVNLHDLKLPSDEDSGKLLDSNLAVQSVQSSSPEYTSNHVTESQFSFGLHVNSDSSEAEILELNHKQTKTETLDEGMTRQTELAEACQNHSQVNGFSDPSTAGSTGTRFEEPSKKPESHSQTTEDNLVHLVEEAESQGVSISSSQSYPASLDHEQGNLGKYSEMNNPHNELKIVNDPLHSSKEHLSTKTDSRKSLSESSEEDQFLFSDVDDSVTDGVQGEDSAFPDTLEIENDPLVTMSDVEDLNELGNMDHKSPFSQVMLDQQCSSNDVEALLEESTPKSSPMSIPRSRAGADEEVEWTIESLPNLRSYIGNLEISEALHPLSHSLDSHSEKLREEVLRKDVLCSSTSELDPNIQLADDDPTVKDKRIWEEFKNLSTNSTIEISLCKHMLYVGMGADAASQAFDAERVDLEKCAFMGPQFVKNDNLIVRIGGRYFPWDAAASYIAEMLSLGHDQIIEPQGMIAVDLVEKTIEGETPRSSVPSGGSWVIWPFSRRRSRTMTSVQAAPDGSNNSGSPSNSERFDVATTNKNSPVVKVAKTKVKSIVPTSEQLATLNLKEGRNVIAFTFSTAMLGKQQVDANIYLWKWNTRIVVSDVDGTITRSDVLGQFMPLVGKDWSHIGVTHLFSAIKENGYQLLFLSARAISQASLTRQFLFNLKQDGKALPEGPVVISPDGLFPSLFREVIRRAPHEFKIACLQDIRALFPPDCSPFYAGFGNRITDEISYRKLGIPKGKIFIINAKGEVAVNRRFDRKSYTSLHALVDGMFPARSSVEQEDFNSWNFWKMPLPDINS